MCTNNSNQLSVSAVHSSSWLSHHIGLLATGNLTEHMSLSCLMNATILYGFSTIWYTTHKPNYITTYHNACIRYVNSPPQQGQRSIEVMLACIRPII